MKNEFQSMTTDEAGGLDLPAVVAGVGSVVVVEAWRIRQREGVKNEDGFEVAVGGLAARTENLERVKQGRAVEMMAVDDNDRFEAVIDEVKKLAVQEIAGRWLDRRRPNRNVAGAAIVMPKM